MSRITCPALIVALTTFCPVTASAEDAVFDMCRERDDETVCSCASEALRGKIDAEAYALYERIGAGYLERMAAGESRADAWTEASQVEAGQRGVTGSALMMQTNDIGKAHRAAIKACGG